MWYLTPTGISIIFAVIGIVLYFMDASSKEEPLDILSAIKYGLLSGAIAGGSVWTYSQLITSTPLSSIEEVFTGIPNF
jgi:hypothetical protein